MIYDQNDYVTDKERKISRALAVAMHVGFVLLLVFGVAWQKRHSEPAAVVDLWSSMTPPRQEPLPPPKPAPKVEVKPEPKVPPRPAPKPEAKPLPKPDIALKDKLEKERKAKEQQELEKKKQELERKKEEDKKLKAQQLEARKKDDEKRKLEQERLAKEAEAKRIAQENENLKAKLAKEQASAQSRAIDEYIRQIQNKVKRNIVEPPNLQGNPEVVFDVRVLPGGEILEDTLRLVRSSGNPAYDQAVERAIRKASPLPVPADPALFDRFRNPTLRIRPKE